MFSSVFSGATSMIPKKLQSEAPRRPRRLLVRGLAGLGGKPLGGDEKEEEREEEREEEEERERERRRESRGFVRDSTRHRWGVDVQSRGGEFGAEEIVRVS